jgi:hypothetical protein
MVVSMNTRRQELGFQKAQLREQMSRRTDLQIDGTDFSGTRRQYLEELTTRIAQINSELNTLPI